MSIFDTLRDQVPVEQVTGGRVGTKILCPAHADGKTPNLHIYADHVYCFSCGFHGDVVDVWAVQHNIDSPIEAAFDLAHEFGIQLPKISKEARQKAAERRERETDNLKIARACHEALSRHEQVREWWEGRGFSPELRERYLLGANKDGTEAVIPFWHKGRVVGLIRRPLDGKPSKYLYPLAEEFVGGHRPLFIPAPVRDDTFVVEGIVDALAVAATGRAAVAVGGDSISAAQRRELGSIAANLYILPDDDEAGAEAAAAWGRTFFPRARICPASYGEGAKDIADTLAAMGVEKIAELLDRLVDLSRDMIDIETEKAAEVEGSVRDRLDYVTKNIAPLLARIDPEPMRDATTDIVAERVKLKKSWVVKAIKAAEHVQLAEEMAALARVAEAEARGRHEEYIERLAEAQPEIDALLVGDGVLGRLREAAARMHNVFGDREPLELALLVALGAQLDPLPNGRPLGASILLTAEAGRGKNHIVDAAVKPMPEEFYFAFEIASGQSLYYKAAEDPEFLKHTFCYPNEIEGAEQLWEFLRPMLSKGKAHKIVTAKDADGNMISREITVEGPVTIAIPTIRNKTDEQLQTRLLVAELTDYPGRVKEHSGAVSRQLLPDAATADYSRERWLWQEALRQLVGIRRVVFPLAHEDFALDDDHVSHGARLWANLLSLMASHAWLEQKNRRLIEVGEGKVAIEATPDDYAAAYRIFAKVCKRTVVNLSDTHRKILNALHDLQREFPNCDGFTQREISKGAGVSQSVVSDNKTFLVMSAKLMKETDQGLNLVEGAAPSWWAEGDLMKGLPTPEKVRSWWEDRHLPPDSADHADHATDQRSAPHTYAEKRDRPPADQLPISNRSGADVPQEDGGSADHDRQAIADDPISENGIGEPKAGDPDSVIGPIGHIEGTGTNSSSDAVTGPPLDGGDAQAGCSEGETPLQLHAGDVLRERGSLDQRTALGGDGHARARKGISL